MADGLRRGAWGWRLAAVTWAVTLYLLSSQTDIPSPGLLPDWLPIDKLVHFGLFGVLSSLLYLGGLTVPLAIAGSAAYGISDEIHQMFVPGRSPELLDLLADLLGASTGAFLARLVHERWTEGGNGGGREQSGANGQ